MNRGSCGKSCLGVMAKFWDPGRVKTRLGASIGMEAAAAIHRLFCSHLAKILCDVASKRSFVITPNDARSQFAALAGTQWSIEIQSDGDLGTRMQTWFETQLSPPFEQPFDAATGIKTASSSSHAVLIGADCPTINRSLVGEALQRLESSDLVLGPAADGGYYLIGIAGPWQPRFVEIFCDMPWSSDSVYERTRARAAALEIKVATLSTKDDVDTVVELDGLRDELSRAADAESSRLLDEINQVLAGKKSS